MIATSSDLARLTVHYCADVLATDEFGAVLGPTSCGIVAGTYGTTRAPDVTCNDCIGAMIDSLFHPPATPNHQEMTR